MDENGKRGALGERAVDRKSNKGDVKMKKRLKLLQVDGMGMFFACFARYWWKPATRQEVIEKAHRIVHYMRKRRVGALNYFMWFRAPDNDQTNAYVKPMCPFPREKTGKKRFYISKIKPKYLRCQEDWEKILKAENLPGLKCFDMAGYCDFPYRNNVEGVPNFFHPAAMEHHVNFVNTTLAIEQAAWNGKIPVGARILNEGGHFGSHKQFHVLGDYHEDLYELSDLSVYVPPKKMFFDRSLSEGVSMWFLGDIPCPKNDPENPVSYCTGRIGSPKYLLDGKHRQIQVVTHGYTIWENVGDHLAIYLGSAWKPPAVWWMGGDGGYHEFAKGHALYKLMLDGTHRILFQQGNGDQTKELVHKVQTAAKAKGYLIGHQITFFEWLQKNKNEWPLKEECTVKRIIKSPDFDRLPKAMRASAGVWRE